MCKRDESSVFVMHICVELGLSKYEAYANGIWFILKFKCVGGNKQSTFFVMHNCVELV